VSGAVWRGARGVAFIGLRGEEEGCSRRWMDTDGRPGLKLGGARGGGSRKWRQGGGVSARWGIYF
jgi:hypothetical protein